MARVRRRASGSASASGEAGLALVRRDSDAAHAAVDAGENALLSALQDGGADAASTEHVVDHGNLGPNWIQAKTNAWRVEGGKLCVQNAHNHGVWLNRTLPVNARIEFDATGYTDDGDLKTEVWGDGVSYATGTSYTNATSYLAILGGWKNTLHVLARLNEHGTIARKSRSTRTPTTRASAPHRRARPTTSRSSEPTARPFAGRSTASTSSRSIDAAPLAGQGHDHFGFNEWEAKVCFDNVKVTPL